jgi:hypothetical protein
MPNRCNTCRQIVNNKAGRFSLLARVTAPKQSVARLFGLRQVNGRPGRYRPHHVAPGIAQRAELNWNGLGVSNYPQWIECFSGIEAHPAAVLCRIVAESPSDNAMRGFMERDREDRVKGPGRCCIEQAVVSLLFSIHSRN